MSVSHDPDHTFTSNGASHGIVAGNNAWHVNLEKSIQVQGLSY